jgi:hypothetical protein
MMSLDVVNKMVSVNLPKAANRMLVVHLRAIGR